MSFQGGSREALFLNFARVLSNAGAMIAGKKSLAGKNEENMRDSFPRVTTSLLAFVLMWSALLLVRPPAASAVPGKLTDDAYTIGGSSTNTGIHGILRVIDAGASTQKTFIQFDLSSLSALPSPLTGADVDKASLTLFVDGLGASGSGGSRRTTS